MTDPSSPEALLARLELGAEGDPRESLAEHALWLALSNLQHAAPSDWEAIAHSTYWDDLAPPSHTTSTNTYLDRVAVGLTLQDCARRPFSGASERVLAALAAVALGCADTRVGHTLQAGFGSLSLLDLDDQVPLARPVRTLSLEFRHLPLQHPVPPHFVARVEDLLERLNAERLLAHDLEDRSTITDDPRLPALIQSRSPSLLSVARVVLFAPSPLPDDTTLLHACLDDSPTIWRRKSTRQALRRLHTCYALLRERLRHTPFQLLPRTQGYGLTPPPEPPPQAP